MDDIFYLPESKLNVDSICTLFQKADVIRVEMLMYGKEASNRKQEIDRQHHTIPNKRTKDQKTSIMEMCITGYGIMDNSIHRTLKS